MSVALQSSVRRLRPRLLLICWTSRRISRLLFYCRRHSRRRTTHGHFSSYLSQFTTWLLCADSGCGSASNWRWRAAPLRSERESLRCSPVSLARFLARVALYSRAVLREYSLAAGLPAGKRRYLDYSTRSEVHSCSGKTVDRFRTSFRGAKMVRTSHITPCRVWWAWTLRATWGERKSSMFLFVCPSRFWTVQLHH